jgi:hypothetical protein
MEMKMTGMLWWKQQAVAERDELAIRLHDLKNYLSCSHFLTLPLVDQELLQQQCTVMDSYVVILNHRIARGLEQE